MASLLDGLGVAVGEPPAEKPPKVEPPAMRPVTRTLAEAVVQEAAHPVGPPETPPPAEPPKPPETPKAPETPPAVPPVTPPPPAPTDKVEVEKRPPLSQIIDQTVRKTIESIQPPKPPETPPPPAVDPFEAQLTDAEKEELAFARWVAGKYPQQYKDLGTQTLNFFKKTQGYIEHALKENPERTFDEHDEEWQKFRRQNAPAVNPQERRKLERAQIEDAAVQRAREETAAEMEVLRRQQRALELRPKIDREANEHAASIEKQLADDEIARDILARVKEVGWDQTLKEDQIFAPLIKDLQEKSAQYATEFQLVTAGIKQPSGQNEVHKWLYDFLQANYKYYKANENLRVRNGKQFLERNEYYPLLAKDPATADKYYTIEEAEFLALLAGNTQQNIKNLIAERNNALKASGFERKPKAAAATPPVTPVSGITKSETQKPSAPPPAAPPAEPHVSPKATVTAAPGASKSTDGTGPSFGTQVLQTLGVLSKD